MILSLAAEEPRRLLSYEYQASVFGTPHSLAVSHAGSFSEYSYEYGTVAISEDRSVLYEYRYRTVLPTFTSTVPYEYSYTVRVPVLYEYHRHHGCSAYCTRSVLVQVVAIHIPVLVLVQYCSRCQTQTGTPALPETFVPARSATRVA